MTIQAEIQSLSPSAMIELFVLDMTEIGASVMRFHAGTNGVGMPIIWQGEEYVPLPIETEGFDMVVRGSLPRPKIRVANASGLAQPGQNGSTVNLFSALVQSLDDLIGAKITRKRTFAKFLDAANFPSGNPTADPNQHFTDDLWYVDQKTTENRYVIEWELACAYDLQGVMLPRREVIQNCCVWKYRGAECGWSGSWFDSNDLATGDQTKDSCSKRLSGCKARFGNSSPLPYGGFPGAVRNA